MMPKLRKQSKKEWMSAIMHECLKWLQVNIHFWEPSEMSVNPRVTAGELASLLTIPTATIFGAHFVSAAHAVEHSFCAPFFCASFW